MSENPNKIWVVSQPFQARVPEYYQYNSVAEALSDFDDWTLEPENIVSCELMYRGVTLVQSFKGKVRGALCEEYHHNCPVRGKLPDSREIVHCEECVSEMMTNHVE